MIPTLERLRQHGVLSPLDEHFARMLARVARENRDEVKLAAALAAGSVGRAHVCLDLAAIAGCAPRPPESDEPVTDLVFPPLAAWLDAIGGSALVRGDGGPSPLVLDGTRLYLRRYYDYETSLAGNIRDRAAAKAEGVDVALLRAGLLRLFPGGGNPNWQRVAAAVSVLRRFTVIAGGPGTGKTWTVARILALLVEQAARGGRVLRAHLLAPTGKAAARLRESIRASRSVLECTDAVRAAIPERAETVHRALGALPDGTFRHDAEHPLVTDVVIVDEASMVDLALMSRLLGAAPDEARVILLGDRDQLASVEAGSVLADVCGDENERRSRFSTSAAAEVEDLCGDRVPPRGPSGSPIGDCIVVLRESRRFRDRPAIGQLAAAIQLEPISERVKAVDEALRSGGGEVSLLAPGSSLSDRLERLAISGYGEYLAETELAKRIEAFGRFRILCAHRRGREGVEAVNALVEAALDARGLVDAREPSYAGRPVLVLRNDRSTELFNGDVGLVARFPDGSRRAVFPALEDAPDGEALRRISLARLPAVETAFAITVHKSQGSEFDRIVVVLPEKPSPILTRELLYTAVTRAREQVGIVGTPAIVARAAETPTRRDSGLRDRLWHHSPLPVRERPPRSGG